MNGSTRSAVVLPASFKSARFIDTAAYRCAGPFFAFDTSFGVHRRATEDEMNKLWPALASATYIGCAGLTQSGCGSFDDRGLFTPPGETIDARAPTSGAGGASATNTIGVTSTTATSSAASTSTTSTGQGGSTGGIDTTGAGGASSGAGGFGDDGGRGTGGASAGGKSGAGGGSVGGAAGTSGGGAGSPNDGGVPKACADLHASSKTARDSAQSCTQAGSFNECRLVQDECGCGVGVRAAATQATQRFLMTVQALKDNGCFDACPDGGCPPYSGATCTPGNQSKLQCIAY